MKSWHQSFERADDYRAAGEQCLADGVGDGVDRQNDGLGQDFLVSVPLDAENKPQKIAARRFDVMQARGKDIPTLLHGIYPALLTACNDAFKGIARSFSTRLHYTDEYSYGFLSRHNERVSA